MARIAINGFGRMGKLLLRVLEDTGFPGEIVLLNDAVGDAAMHAHLLEFDTVHGRWPAAIDARDDTLVVGERRMRVTQSATLAGLGGTEIQAALESRFPEDEKCHHHNRRPWPACRSPNSASIWRSTAPGPSRRRANSSPITMPACASCWCRRR